MAFRLMAVVCNSVIAYGGLAVNGGVRLHFFMLPLLIFFVFASSQVNIVYPKYITKNILQIYILNILQIYSGKYCLS